MANITRQQYNQVGYMMEKMCEYLATEIEYDDEEQVQLIIQHTIKQMNQSITSLTNQMNGQIVVDD